MSARKPIGKASACKADVAGSTPARASISMSERLRQMREAQYAGVKVKAPRRKKP